jgi:hypothetical protein
MRHTITGLVAGAVLAAVTAGATPASACEVLNPCGGGLFQSGYNYNYGPRAAYGYNGYAGCGVVAGGCGVVATGCGAVTTGCGGYATERLPDPTGPQYYYVNQGPTYTGPGNYAPAPVYQERTVTGWQGYEEEAPAVYTVPRRHYRPYRAGPSYHYGYRPAYRHYGYRARPVVRYGYAPRFYGPRHSYMHGPRVRYAPQIGTRGYPLRYKF